MNTDPATAAASSAYGSNANQIAASRVMLSYVFLQLVDSFGDVPYYSYGNQDPDFQDSRVTLHDFSDIFPTNIPYATVEAYSTYRRSGSQLKASLPNT